jgi:bacillolysin
MPTPSHNCRRLAVVLAIGVVLVAVHPSAQETGSQKVVRLAATSGDRALRDWDAQVDRLTRAGELRLVSTREDTMLEGRTHERLDQYHRGVRVVGGQIVRQLEGSLTQSIFGTLYEQIELDTTPRLSADQARDRAAAITGGKLLQGRAPELVVLPQDDRYSLAWIVYARTTGDIVQLFIDAATGAELKRLSALHHQAAVGTGTGVRGDRKKVSTTRVGDAYYASDDLRPPVINTLDMKSNIVRTFDILDGIVAPAQSDIASDGDNTWSDPAVVDAHAYLGWSYDYAFKRFGRRGVDNADRPVLAIVHPVDRANLFASEELLLFFVNAFYCPPCGPNGVGMLMFGEGVPPNVSTIGGQYIDYFSAALDIVAHEFTHGVTHHTSRLILEGEPGALNEGFSDIMGVGTEFFFASTGGQQTDYIVGEDTIRPVRPGAVAGLRSLADPGMHGNPDHYSRRFTGFEDSGGIHINATIPGHAFYLAIEGGTNRTSGLSVQGVGGGNREQIERIFYRGFTSFLTPNSRFADARRATLQAATELYGGSSPAFRAVQQAWDAVGVN